MSYLGIDFGSSGTKAVVFDENGHELASARRGYSFLTPRPDWMELEPTTVLRAAEEAIAEAAAAVKNTDPIRALAISSQGEAFTPLDENNRPLANAMISGDSRAASIMNRFCDSFGQEKIYQITGHTPSGIFTLAKLLWLAENRPEIRRKAIKFLCFEDLLINDLCGSAFISHPLAGRTMLFDVSAHSWSRPILDAAGFRKSEFALPVPSGTVVGTIRPKRAEDLNLSFNAKIVTGGHDQVLGTLGCGAWSAGTAMYAAGSVECLVPVVDHLIFSDTLRKSNLCSYDFALPDKYVSIAYSLTGSNLLEYFMNNYARDLNGDYDRLLAEMPDSPSRLLVLPYFTPSGTPYFDNETPGTVWGWRLGTSRGELLKGLQEGIGFEMKLNLELLQTGGFKIDKLIATGGGFKSSQTRRLHADLLGLPIQTADVHESGCRGAALLAQSADIGIPVEDLPHSFPKIIDETEPNPNRFDLYSELFEHWKKFANKIRSENFQID